MYARERKHKQGWGRGNRHNEEAGEEGIGTYNNKAGEEGIGTVVKCHMITFHPHTCK